MSAYRYDRRRGNERRRSSSRGGYAGTERRNGRERRNVQGRRGYDDENGGEAYYYSGQKKQQNPMVYFGVAGGVILLIIIIAVASGGSKGKKNNPAYSKDDTAALQMEKQARELIMRGGEAMRVAQLAYQESGTRTADPHYRQAYSCFEQAHGLYEKLNEQYPGTRFYGALQDLERDLYDVQKRIGTH